MRDNKLRQWCSVSFNALLLALTVGCQSLKDQVGLGPLELHDSRKVGYRDSAEISKSLQIAALSERLKASETASSAFVEKNIRDLVQVVKDSVSKTDAEFQANLATATKTFSDQFVKSATNFVFTAATNQVGVSTNSLLKLREVQEKISQEVGKLTLGLTNALAKTNIAPWIAAVTNSASITNISGVVSRFSAEAISIFTNTTTTSEVSAYLQIASDDDVSNEFGRTFMQCFFVGELVIENSSTNSSALVYSSSLQTHINYFMREVDWLKEPAKAKIAIVSAIENFGGDTNLTEQLEFIPSQRRPSTYSDILAIFEYQRKGNLRQRVFDAFKSAAEVAAGASIFVGGSAYPKAIALTTGVITPELEKNLLWDVVLHAKNLEARSMKEIEEVPAASSIHRVVFFPKRGIPGVIPNYLVYINSFKAKTPVVVKGSLVNKVKPVASQ